MRCSSCSRPVKPVVAVDIDGTLADYHVRFLHFAEDWLDRPFRTERLEYTGNDQYSSWFCDVFGVDLTTFRAIKLAYRQGGNKRWAPSFPGAVELVTALREEGAEVWLTTTRPWERYDRVDPDTREWLRRHDIEFDALLYDADKLVRLADNVDPERVIAVVDDEAEQLELAGDLFPHSFNVMAAGPHNSESAWTGERHTIAGMRSLLLQRVYRWLYNNKEDQRA